MVTTDPTPPDRISPIRIEDEMRESYLTYAMSVIVSRALPDVRDGLKPVQRRILYSMHEMGIRANSSYKKSARIVGEVLGKYHPHGDSSVYAAMVRMAQDFSMRYPLVDGQGNFGSVDGDPPAAMRYTEARLARVAEQQLTDIDLDTVDFNLNFDDSIQEPQVLPTRLPTLLINGASGIAVGMATSMPPHNLSEICEAINYVINNPTCTSDELLQIVPGPDFPTAGIIKGRSGIVDTYTTGRGRIVMEAATDIEETRNGRQRIIVTELPYQVNKSSLVEKIAQLVRDKRIQGISDIRDESDRKGMRIVIELRRDAQPNITLNNLYRHTQLRDSFNSNMLALVNGQPQVLPLKRMIELFIQHRQQIIRRRSEFLLQKAKDRDHVVQGLLLALDRMDEIIAIIRGSDDVTSARENLMSTLTLSEIQAQAILDMQLRRLAALERQRLEKEHEELLAEIKELEELLGDESKILEQVKVETDEINKQFGNPRRTVIHDAEVTKQTDADLIPHSDVVITLSKRGYIKRVPADTYRTQHRGGKGVRGMSTRDDDELMEIYITDTHDHILLFTNRGRVYPLRAFDISEDTSRTTRGTQIINLVPLERGETVQTILPVKDPKEDYLMVLVTKQGQVKALRAGELVNIRARGLIAMNLKSDDELVGVQQVEESDDIIMVSQNGQAMRFSMSNLSPRRRGAGGVRGMRLLSKDQVISVGKITEDSKLLIVSSGGYGKATALEKYSVHGRGGQGVRTFKVTAKTGNVAAAKIVPTTTSQDIFIISAKAQLVRIDLDQIRTSDRNTSGVILWRDREPDDYIVSIGTFERDEKKQ
ncbi:MAG: DNA gyrase subunit A [SAR202 cluster bacterium]|jgi:DNA gyrase subunit A|nr:DNA gyrase subunit A [Dehalococcoidia bacterium]MQG08073.1 DNA gyrase subunit A [SAR202 cluster bacterium]MQG26160.1 DNA gyrase subunit A [SAR202 cluster bacterium]MQG52812.1 DNA gyrase subunit A [SAR202 cluster bacterium]CAI8363721.1 MAG: DNA gyrase subunit A [Chloroflexota bacterium]|tara:strand:+ start:5134 stop:7596 length:2463 start_codon:yes stop_codon:yes gene_type:complete